MRGCCDPGSRSVGCQVQGCVAVLSLGRHGVLVQAIGVHDITTA